MESSIDKFIGKWVNSDGNQLIIRRRTGRLAVVSFLIGPNGIPLSRPYYDGRPSTDMEARVRDYGSTLQVNLWTSGKGFELHLTFENSYQLDERRRSSLVPALTWREEDTTLDEYCNLFGRLKHFTRADN